MTAERAGADAMPVAEVAIDASVIRALLARQVPDLASEPITIVANGWDNVVARLGDELAVRVPRRRSAVALLEHEWSWLPAIAERIPVAVPVPVHLGEPDHGIPWPWTIVRWIDGTAADAAPPPTFVDVDRLVAVMRALAVPAPNEAPTNPSRGVPLAARADRVTTWLDRIGGPDCERLRLLWESSVAAAPHPGPPVWLHGDLHPANLVSQRDGLAGILDWGDVTAGDPAADLQIAWTWLGPAERDRFLDALGCDEATVQRARGNALAHGAATLASSADNPRMAAIGSATLRQVLLSA